MNYDFNYLIIAKLDGNDNNSLTKDNNKAYREVFYSQIYLNDLFRGALYNLIKVNYFLGQG